MATIATTKKSTKGRKSAAIALAVVGVAGLSLASAAQLTVNNSSLGAGVGVVASCDTTGITVGYGTVYNATTGAYDTNALNLSGVNANCNNLKYSVQLTSGAAPGTALGSPITGTLTVTGTLDTGTATIAVSPAVAAASVTGVAIVIFS